ncbi:SH2 domain-containing protein 6 [Argiope bruennichi]|uniref:SH2 domain-containing protein 6 n=1 Tax=Argiope bruennichi TaxID=94029 RepID=A0A8T0F1Z0_ARGBR|nr:SH2 domain-containing protein 6 [Argiope bruennichi]
MAQFANTFASHAPGDDDEDWGSDFEGELCSQEIEDNKINEIREANLLRNSTNDGNVLSEDNTQTVQTFTGNHIVNARKTGAIPKSGFSYLSNTNDNKAFLAIGIQSGNNSQPQRQASQPAAQSGNASMNSENSQIQSPTRTTSDNDTVTKKTPRKLKPEAFSFLNKLPQRNVSENGSGVSKERKTLTPTAFSHAEKLSFSKSQGNSIMALNDTPEASANEIPSAPPLENTPSNYETITEDSFSEFDLTSIGNTTNKEDEKPPLPARPPPVFKYPPETFSSPRPISIESTCTPAVSQPLSQSAPVYPKLNSSISPPDSVISHPPLQSAPVYPKLNSSISPPDSAISHPPLQSVPVYPKLNSSISPPDSTISHPPLQSAPVYPKLNSSISPPDSTISHPPLQSAPAYPKLGHSISSPDSGLKYNNATPQDRILNKMNNRKSLPAIPVCPAVPKRPLPPLPMSNTNNVSKVKSQNDTIRLESSDSMNEEKWPEEAPTIHGTIFNHQVNELPIFEESVQRTAFKEPVLQEQLIPSPQQRLAQILTNQTSVDSTILRSQQKIASAIASRVTGSQSSSISRLQTTEESDFHNGGRPKELIWTMPGRSLENDPEQVIEDASERQPSYLEAKEATNPRRFTVNSRPLTYQSEDLQDLTSITLAMFLCDNPTSKTTELDVLDGNHLRKRLRFRAKMIQVLRERFRKEYLGQLVQRHRQHPQSSKIYIGDIVLILSTLQEYAWFHDVEAKEGQLRLLSVGQDGTFLIRPSSRPTEDIQNTMCILYNGKVRNLHIRRRDDGRYVLGTKANKSFSSIAEMIRHHQEIPVEILPHGSTLSKPQMYRIFLKETPPKLQKLFAVV